MKVILLAGGYGTRLAEETGLRPKPMVEIGGRPILWHIMKIYAHYGISDFVVACGYKSEFIKDYFVNFGVRHSDWLVSLRMNSRVMIGNNTPDWNIAMVDTGIDTMTGGRILRLQDHVGKERFGVTYGDAVSNIDINNLLKFHRSHGRLATLTAVRPPARFGSLEMAEGQVTHFAEKPQTGEGWINGGFFVFEPGVFDYLEDDKSVLERAPLERLCKDGQLMAYQHPGFWQPMDTIREKHLLEELWNKGNAPWKCWSEENAGLELSRNESATHGIHGVQGGMAGDVAEEDGRSGRRPRSAA